MQAVRLAYPKWLDGFAWDHFCTLTFTDGCSDAFARQAFNRFARRVEHSAGSPISWFWVLERGACRAMPHLHALLGGTARLTVRSIDGQWRVGLRRVRRYDPRRSAAWYVTKRILDDMTDYDVSQFLRRKVPAPGDQ
jgi:hypothetical protein